MKGTSRKPGISVKLALEAATRLTVGSVDCSQVVTRCVLCEQLQLVQSCRPFASTVLVQLRLVK